MMIAEEGQSNPLRVSGQHEESAADISKGKARLASTREVPHLLMIGPTENPELLCVTVVMKTLAIRSTRPNQLIDGVS